MVLNAHAHQQNERKRTPFFRYRRREKEEEIEKRERKERKRCMIVCDNMDHNTHPHPQAYFLYLPVKKILIDFIRMMRKPIFSDPM